MFRIRHKLGLPRTAVACYLLFCLLALGGLAAGIFSSSLEIAREHLLRDLPTNSVYQSDPAATPDRWMIAYETLVASPLPLGLPILAVGLGGFLLARLLRPVTELGAQLAQLANQPQGSHIDLERVEVYGELTEGWNRLVGCLERFRHESLDDEFDDGLMGAIANHQLHEYDAILQNLAEGIAVTDFEGRITFANRAIATLLNTDPSSEDLKGQALQELLIQDPQQDHLQSLFEPAAASHPVSAEIPVPGDSTNRVLRVSRQCMQAPSHQRQVWSLQDITQQKLVDSTRNEFIETATHELRTPLSNIKAYVETLATTGDIAIEQQQEFCHIINSEVTRLARFVDDLLSISSMEVGSLSVEKHNIVTERLVDEVIQKVQPLIAQKEIHFQVSLPKKARPLALDKDKMVAVLVNLLGNAIKYTPRGGCVALQVCQDKTQLQLTVTDSGIGIAPEELPTIFDKFFRSSDPRVQAETGTGLGLSLAREVVRIHGGDIGVESKLDEGSAFTVTIPLK